jgi:shikimate kinase
MGWKFVDMDRVIEERHGLSVSEIFSMHGEDLFRREEENLAKELVASSKRVVATGGGTILNPRILEEFQRTGILICLFTTRDQFVARLGRTDKRPLLQGEQHLGDRVDELLAERQEIYNRIRTRVDTTHLSPREAAEKIRDLLQTMQKVLDQLQSRYTVIS